jgi:WhiB family transcriptional regulator, redox-sensing transcriptional regulator
MKAWRSDALCADSDDPDLWWPIGTTGDVTERQVREAKVWCRSCPVQRECLIEALAAGPIHQHGIWGGMTEQGRISLLRRRQREANRSARAAVIIANV